MLLLLFSSQDASSSQQSARGGVQDNSRYQNKTMEQGNNNSYAGGYNRGGTAAPQQQVPSTQVYRPPHMQNRMNTPNGNFSNNNNMSDGYRGPVNPGTGYSQQNYGNSYAGGNVHMPQQQAYYGQPPPQMYHQPMSNNYQQMGHMARPMNPAQTYDNRAYGQASQQQMPMQNRSFNDMSQVQSSYNRPGPNDGINQQQSGGRWDAILAERQMSTYSNSSSNSSYQRPRGGGGGGGYSNNYNNRNNGGYGGQRDNNYNRRDQGSNRAYHSHVGGQSGDMIGADWNTPLPPNPTLER